MTFSYIWKIFYIYVSYIESYNKYQNDNKIDYIIVSFTFQSFKIRLFGRF